MIRSKLNSEYFSWLCRLVCSGRCTGGRSYRRLLRFLHNVDFNYTIAMDGNREEDGIDLRYRFGHENSYEHAMITAYLDNRPCNILEMMIALAIRCEEHIMADPDIGNRTGLWFWGMVSNLGLEAMTDAEFDEDYADRVITRFLNRDYGRNGEGGLFTVERYGKDLRTVEIWYQMCWYLDEIA